MNRLKLLDAGLRAFDTRLPDVAPPLCVATRYRASGCRLCLDVCPAGAIATTPWLQVDPQRCTACGACSAACKTGALSFVTRSRTLRSALQEAVTGGTGATRFVCRMADVPAEAADCGGAGLVVGCLGGLSAGDLIAAAALGPQAIELVDSGCGSCPDRIAGVAADGVADVARATLAAFQVAVPVTRVTQATPGSSGADIVAQTVAQAETMSRRALFAGMARRLRRTVVEGTAPDKRSVTALHSQAPPPETRARLLDDLATLASGSSQRPASLPAALPLAHLAAGTACDGCGLCVCYCPHAALSLEAGRVVCNDALCSGCGLCIETCPPAALTMEPAALEMR
jgi:ferredoxin